jgi:hypothetical protein
MKPNRVAPLVACVILGLIFLPVLYVLSIGPAVWLSEHGYLSDELGRWIYAPLSAAANHYPAIGRWLVWYMSLFGDLGRT